MTNPALRNVLAEFLRSRYGADHAEPDAEDLLDILRNYVPSEAMIKAWASPCVMFGISDAQACLAEWRAMIDAAIQESKG